MIEEVARGALAVANPGLFDPILHVLRENDRYLHCADFDSYRAAQRPSQRDLSAGPATGTRWRIRNVAVRWAGSRATVPCATTRARSGASLLCAFSRRPPGLSETFDYDLVCIGSGPAGQRAAVQAAKLGKRVAVIEKQRCAGGVCIETGTIPSKTFREAVRTFRARARGHAAERAPASGPAWSSSSERVARVIQREGEVVEDQLARNEVDLVRGRAAFAGPARARVGPADGARRLTARTSSSRWARGHGAARRESDGRR